MPLVTLVIGTSCTGTPFQTSFQSARLTSPCNLLTPFEWRLIRRARIVMLNGSERSTRVWPNEKSSSKVIPHHLARERIVTGRHRCVSGEDIGRSDNLERGVEVQFLIGHFSANPF